MRFLISFLLIARHAMAQSARGLRLVALSLLAMVPLLLTALIVSVDNTIEFSTFANVTLFVSYQVIIPLLALILGVSVLGDEIEGRTLTYLYTRPLPRPFCNVTEEFRGRRFAFGVQPPITPTKSPLPTGTKTRACGIVSPATQVAEQRTWLND